MREYPHIIVYHDESIYNVNDSNNLYWHDKATAKHKIKGKGKGIMVSDFITEDGFLDEFGEGNLRILLEYNSEGNWDIKKLIS